MDLKPELKDPRLEDLNDWCAERLNAVVGCPLKAGLEAVSGDASFRRYFRAHTSNKSSFIVVDAPPEHEDCESFVAIAKSWKGQGVRTPEIHSVDLSRGYMLLEDFGDSLLYSGLNGKSVQGLYNSAFEALHKLQGTSLPTGYKLPLFDEQRLRREMQLFPDWCLDRLLKKRMAVDEKQLLADLFDRLVASALEQPQVPVHLDYHSRNIMMLPDGLGLIDFQDAVLGPVTYDPVSLLRDCYIDWSQKQVYQWLDQFAEDSPHLKDIDHEQLYRWFDWMGMQRHIKVLGIFVRLWLRDGKEGYLKDIPRVYAYLCWVCERYEEMKDISQWLSEELTPLLHKQKWWQDYQLKA